MAQAHVSGLVKKRSKPTLEFFFSLGPLLYFFKVGNMLFTMVGNLLLTNIF